MDVMNVHNEYARLVVVMGGGYPKSLDPASLAFQTVVQLHVNVYIQANKVFKCNL